MVHQKLEIVKVPMKKSIPDISINFSPLPNLRLDMMENKSKIKPGLPLIPLKPIKQKIKSNEEHKVIAEGGASHIIKTEHSQDNDNA